MNFIEFVMAMGEKNLAQLLQTKGIAQDTIERFAKMIADCDFARYAPQAQAATMAEELFAEAENIMNDLA